MAWGAAISFFYTRHIVTNSTTELYSLVKIFLMVFEIEGIVALIIKGRLLRKYSRTSMARTPLGP